jgi:hypothetical protein
VAISLFSMHYEIASVVSLPRDDIVIQPPDGEDKGEGENLRFMVY